MTKTIKKKLLAGMGVAVTGTVLAVTVGVPAAFAAGGAAFNDPAFDQCVRTNLGTAPGADLDPAAVAGITDLNCDSFGIKTLDGAQQLTGLQSFSAKDNSITDLTPLSPLSNLTTGDFSNQSFTYAPTTAGSTTDTTLFRNVDGSELALGSTNGSYDSNAHLVTWNTPPAGENGKISWSTNSPFAFSGEFTQPIEAATATLDAPTGVKATSTQPGVARITWDNYPTTTETGDVVSYSVQYRPVGVSTWTQITIPNTMNVTDIYSLDGDTDYEFQVAVTTTNGHSLYSASANVSIGSYPNDILGLDWVVDNGVAHLSWAPVKSTDTNGNGDLDHYVVSWQPVGGTTSEVRSTDDAFFDLPLDAGVTYDVFVTYVTSTGAMPKNQATATVAANGSSQDNLPVVTGLKVTDVTADGFTLVWSPVTDTDGNGDVASYTVSWGDGQSGDGAEVPANVTSHKFSGLDPNKTYMFSVGYTTTTGATGGYAETPLSVKLADLQTTNPVVKDAPALTDLAAKAGSEKGQVILTWTGVDKTTAGTNGNGKVKSYTAFYREVGATDWVKIGDETGTDASNTMTLVNFPKGKYEFMVRYTTDTDKTSVDSNTATLELTEGVEGGKPGINNDANSVVNKTGEDTGYLTLLGGILVAGAAAIGLTGRGRRKLKLVTRK